MNKGTNTILLLLMLQSSIAIAQQSYSCPQVTQLTYQLYEDAKKAIAISESTGRCIMVNFWRAATLFRACPEVDNYAKKIEPIYPEKKATCEPSSPSTTRSGFGHVSGNVGGIKFEKVPVSFDTTAGVVMTAPDKFSPATVKIGDVEYTPKKAIVIDFEKLLNEKNTAATNKSQDAKNINDLLGTKKNPAQNNAPSVPNVKK